MKIMSTGDRYILWSKVYKISSELRSLGRKEHIKETKIADSVLLSLFMCSNVKVQHCPRPLAPVSAAL